jgi:apolipoprotein N-acyltransferase
VAALAALVTYAAGTLNVWSYLHDAIRIPTSVIINVVVMPGVMLALCALLYRRLLLRGRTLSAICAPPAIWVASEYINSSLSPHGTFFIVGYTQMNVLPLIQLAAVTGLWGISFLLLLIPSALAALGSRQATHRQRMTLATTVTLTLVFVVAFGSWRLQAMPTASLRVGLVSLEHDSQPTLDSADGQALIARYADAVDQLARQGAQVVVIPEASWVVRDATIPTFAQLAHQHRMVLDIGIDSQGDPHAERNMAMVFQPDAAAPLTYSKHHLIPGFEAKYTPGREQRMLDGQPRIGLAICKDMDFIDTGRAYAGLGAQLLLVPAWDFDVDGWLHSRMAIMRGVEHGFAVARVARSGRLTLSDDRGRVIAEATSEGAGARLIGDLPLRETRTLYSRWGDWFAWLALGGLLALIALACLPRR